LRRLAASSLPGFAISAGLSPDRAARKRRQPKQN
jgi:hypothetical protein